MFLQGKIVINKGPLTPLFELENIVKCKKYIALQFSLQYGARLRGNSKLNQEFGFT